MLLDSRHLNALVSAREYARVGACVPAICEQACNRALGIGRYRFPSAAQTSLLHQDGFHILDLFDELLQFCKIESIVLLENIGLIAKKIINSYLKNKYKIFLFKNIF